MVSSVDSSMAGKVVLVTGSTSGIGEQTARALAGRGATVILNGRSRDRCAAVARRLQEETGNPSIDLLPGDLSTGNGVRAVAEAFRAQHDRLDVLINNVGAIFWKRDETADGVERTFALNHLSYFHLTTLLLDRLEASAPSRVVNVASDTHRGVRLDFDDLQAKQSYSAMAAYNRSKLANVLFTYELARRLKDTGVTANALHPGVTSTNWGKGGGAMTALMWVVMRFVQSAERGAQTSVYLATSPDVASSTGKYFKKQREAPSSPESHDEAAARRLWEVSAALIG
jgi:NAD(P)-dependent dehydrogenase (short-subunit alcohol dehydrogenase family)